MPAPDKPQDDKPQNEVVIPFEDDLSGQRSVPVEGPIDIDILSEELASQGKPVPLVLIEDDGASRLYFPNSVSTSKVSLALRDHRRPLSPGEARKSALDAAEGKAKKGDLAGAVAGLIALLRDPSA